MHTLLSSFHSYHFSKVSMIFRLLCSDLQKCNLTLKSSYGRSNIITAIMVGENKSLSNFSHQKWPTKAPRGTGNRNNMGLCTFSLQWLKAAKWPFLIRETNPAEFHHAYISSLIEAYSLWMIKSNIVKRICLIPEY